MPPNNVAQALHKGIKALPRKTLAQYSAQYYISAANVSAVRKSSQPLSILPFATHFNFSAPRSFYGGRGTGSDSSRPSSGDTALISCLVEAHHHTHQLAVQGRHVGTGAQFSPLGHQLLPALLAYAHVSLSTDSCSKASSRQLLLIHCKVRLDGMCPALSFNASSTGTSALWTHQGDMPTLLTLLHPAFATCACRPPLRSPHIPSWTSLTS